MIIQKVLIVVLLFIFFQCFAQKTFSYGLKGGLNIASVNSDGIIETTARISFHVGGFLEIPLTNEFTFQPELLYSAQGYKFDNFIEFRESGEDLPITLNPKIVVKFSYLNIPLAFSFYPTEKFSLQFGPQVGFLLSAKSKSSDVGVPGLDNGNGVQDVKTGFNTTDLSLFFGVGYKIQDKVFVEARYNMGLNTLNKNGGIVFGESFKNRVIQVSLSYIIN